MQLLKRLFPKKTILFENITNDWLSYKRTSVKTSTFYRYQYIISQYIIPYFKHENIYLLQDYDFNIFITHLSNNQISKKTVKDIILVLKAILKYIERKYKLDYTLDLIPLPKYSPEEIQILDENEKNILENYCLKSNSLREMGIAICLNTGMRIGEICALKWENIDLENRVFIVNKSLQRIYKGKKDTSILIDTSKTKNSIRKIPISDKILTMLNMLNSNQDFSGKEYFLTGTQNKHIEPRNYQYFFKKCLINCNIKEYHFHVLRHTFASNCIKIGMDAKTLSQILGHSTVNMTLNRYVHSSYNTQKTFLEKL